MHRSLPSGLNSKIMAACLVGLCLTTVSVFMGQSVAAEAESKAPVADSANKGLADLSSLTLLHQLGWQNLISLITVAPDSPLPEKVAYVRVSHSFLKGLAQRQVSHQAPVRDRVLGAEVLGTSSASGATEIVFIPDKHRLVAEMRLNTSVNVQSVANHYPVHVFSRGVTRVEAGKRIDFDGAHFTVSPAWAKANTQSTTTGITSDLKLFNRMAVRVAAKRVAEEKAEIDRITAEHTAEHVRQEFEQASTAELAQLEQLLREQFANLTSSGPLVDYRIACSTNSNTIEVVLTLSDEATTNTTKSKAAIRTASRSEATSAPPTWSQTPGDVELFVHSGLVIKALRDSSLQRALTPMLQKLLPSGDHLNAADSRDAEKSATADRQPGPQWSCAGQWYAVSWSNAPAESGQSKRLPEAPAKLVSTGKAAQAD